MPRTTAGNPLWIQWLEEARDAALERQPEGHRHRAWHKAAQAFKTCTATFAHPSQARQLKFVGDASITYLTKRLREHCVERGIPMPDPGDGTPSYYQSDDDMGADTNPRPAKRSKVTDEGVAHPPRPGHNNGDASDATTNDQRGTKGKAASAKSPKSKAYMPRTRTGGFALLVAFVKSAASTGSADVKESSLEFDLRSTDVQNWLSQPELEALASRHSDTSFAEKSGGGGKTGQPGFFSAWSGMKTLLTKAYVVKQGRKPVRYQITAIGLPIANICAECEGIPRFEGNDDHLVPSHNNLAEPQWDSSDDSLLETDVRRLAAMDRPTPPIPPMQNVRAPIDRTAAGFRAANGASARVYSEVTLRRSSSPPRPARTRDPKFDFIYLTSKNARTTWRAQADSNIDPDDFTEVYKIEFRKDQQDHDFAMKHLLPIAMPAPLRSPGACQEGTLAGWLRNVIAPEAAPGLILRSASYSSVPNGLPEAAVAAAQKRAIDARESLLGNASRSGRVDKLAMYRPPASSRPLGSSVSSSTVPLARHTNLFRSSSDPPPVNADRTVDKSASSCPEQPIVGTVRATGPAPHDAHAERSAPSASTSLESSRLETNRDPLRRTSTTAIAFDPIHLSSAEADAIASVSGGAALSEFDPREAIVMRPGDFSVELVVDYREHKLLPAVKMSVRAFEEALELGDFIWVARRHGGPSDKPEDLLVLDGILERKAMDDLISSIKDNRYEEQKMRIKMSGTTRRMYMIQAKDRTEDSAWNQQYWTVSSQSQVSDGFMLVHVSSPAEATACVVRMTKVMAQIHESTTLYGIPDRYVDRASYLALQADLRKKHPTTPFLCTFSSFQRINNKHHTLRSGWANMLFSQTGMSAEKVCDIVDRWETPFSFRQAIKAQIEHLEQRPVEAGTGKSKKVKPGEGWLEEQIRRAGTRGVKQALSKYLWHLFASNDYAQVAF